MLKKQTNILNTLLNQYHFHYYTENILKVFLQVCFIKDNDSDKIFIYNN